MSWPFVKKSTHEAEVTKLRNRVGAEYARGLKGGQAEAANALRKQHRAENDLTLFVQRYASITPPTENYRDDTTGFYVRISGELVRRARMDHAVLAEHIARIAASNAINWMRSYR